MLLHHPSAVEGQRAFVVAGPRSRESKLPEEAVRGVRYTVRIDFVGVFWGRGGRRIIAHVTLRRHQRLRRETSISSRQRYTLIL